MTLNEETIIRNTIMTLCEPFIMLASLAHRGTQILTGSQMHHYMLFAVTDFKGSV